MASGISKHSCDLGHNTDYKNLVCPQLEYASTVGPPPLTHTHTQIKTYTSLSPYNIGQLDG